MTPDSKSESGIDPTTAETDEFETDADTTQDEDDDESGEAIANESDA